MGYAPVSAVSEHIPFQNGDQKDPKHNFITFFPTFCIIGNNQTK
jgi:hypothetical protein